MISPFKIGRYFISLALMGLFLYWAFKGIEPAALWAAMGRVSPFWVSALVFTTILSLGLRAWRWIVLMRPFASIPVLAAFQALAICYTANLVIPRSGEALRIWSLNWSRGASISAVLATVVVERIIDLFCLIALVGASLLLLRSRIDQAFPWLEPASLIVLAGCILVLLLLALVSIYRNHALRIIPRLLGKISSRMANRSVRVLETFLQGLSALGSPTACLEIIVSSILLNLCYLLIIYGSFLSFGFIRSFDLGASATMVVMAISTIGIIVPTPAGVGSYHLFFGDALHLLYQVPETAAMACATVVHAIANLTYLALGAPALLWQFWSVSKKGEGKNDPVHRSGNDGRQ